LFCPRRPPDAPITNSPWHVDLAAVQYCRLQCTQLSREHRICSPLDATVQRPRLPSGVQIGKLAVRWANRPTRCEIIAVCSSRQRATQSLRSQSFPPLWIGDRDLRRLYHGYDRGRFRRFVVDPGPPDHGRTPPAVASGGKKAFAPTRAPPLDDISVGAFLNERPNVLKSSAIYLSLKSVWSCFSCIIRGKSMHRDPRRT
jgi:hypothetical protein